MSRRQGRGTLEVAVDGFDVVIPGVGGPPGAALGSGHRAAAGSRPGAAVPAAAREEAPA